MASCLYLCVPVFSTFIIERVIGKRKPSEVNNIGTIVVLFVLDKMEPSRIMFPTLLVWVTDTICKSLMFDSDLICC